MKLKLVAFVCLLLGSSIVMAGNCTAQYCIGQVKTIYPNGGNGYIYLKMDANMSQLNCTLAPGGFIVLKGSNLRHKEIYSMLLAAQLAQKDVMMRIIENSSDCELIYTQTNL